MAKTRKQRQREQREAQLQQQREAQLQQEHSEVSDVSDPDQSTTSSKEESKHNGSDDEQQSDPSGPDTASVSEKSESDSDEEAKQDVAWKHHPARALLKEAFLSKEIPLDYSKSMGPRAVCDKYKKSRAFKGMPYDGAFTRRLRSLRVQAEKKVGRVEIDIKAYELFRKHHPIQNLTNRGKPRWDGSAAQALLKIEMKEGWHKSMQPKALWESDEVCQDFDLEVFRKHIDQEERLWKLENLLRTKAKKEAKKRGEDVSSSSSGGSDVSDHASLSS